ncbi:ribosomal-protein-alanine N-acetyltransferase [Oxalobacteraceae bacterium CAVE-383]|nr:ribosomal-protein-alanine N-acetyltransferase [Oxalobacteraceae bacterium CAVE-383]
MSALAESAELVCAAMRKADIEEVMAIEQRVYSHPWTYGNFEDSLSSAYDAHLLRDAAGRLLGYFLMMRVVDEAHLLNLSVDAEAQHQGYGQRLMHEAVKLARRHNLKTMLLEVRVSNRQALAFYSRFGFREIGRRKNYYPVGDAQREDAIMMTIAL